MFRLILILTAVLATRVAGADESLRPQYTIKEDRPPIGSHIRREAVGGSNIPINMTYHQLSSEHRAVVHSWYERIEPGDEPPFPKGGLNPIHDALRKGQASLKVSGRMFLVATVEPDGQVSTVKAIGMQNRQMADFAGKVLLLTKFKPAVCGRRPCRMDFPLVYKFVVN